MDFLFFSAEATTPSGYLLMELIKPVKRMFYEHFFLKEYTPNLDSVAIIFVCFLRSPGKDDWFKDRRYVSRKNRYADIRLNIDYDMFIQSNPEERLKMMWEIIVAAIEYIAKKDPKFKKNELLEDLKFCFIGCYSERSHI